MTKTTHGLEQTADGWLLSLQGMHAMCFNNVNVYDVRFAKDGDAYGLHISLESPILLVGGGIERIDLSDEQGERKFEKIFTQEPKNVTFLHDGSLELRIGGMTVRIEGGDRFEPWSFTDPNHLLIVSIPGHQLATWLPVVQ